MIDKEKLEKELQRQADEIFTTNNIPAILFYLNQNINEINGLIGDNEFDTIVRCAKIDGQRELIRNIKDKFYEQV